VELEAYLLVTNSATHRLEGFFTDVMESGLEVQTAHDPADGSSYPLVRIMYTVHQLA
jgi:hypothetical protein